MSGMRIDIGARPLADPQTEAWVRQGAAIYHRKAERYSARLTAGCDAGTAHADQASGLRPRRDHGGNAARSAEAAGHVMTPGTHQAWRPLTLPAGSIFALGWAALVTSPPASLQHVR